MKRGWLTDWQDKGLLQPLFQLNWVRHCCEILFKLKTSHNQVLVNFSFDQMLHGVTDKAIGGYI